MAEPRKGSGKGGREGGLEGKEGEKRSGGKEA